MSDTPRTDAFSFQVIHSFPTSDSKQLSKNQVIEVVLADDCRKLEADLAEANARAQGLYDQAQANHIRAINAETEVIELKKMLPRSMVGLSDAGEQ